MIIDSLNYFVENSSTKIGFSIQQSKSDFDNSRHGTMKSEDFDKVEILQLDILKLIGVPIV